MTLAGRLNGLIARAAMSPSADFDPDAYIAILFERALLPPDHDLYLPPSYVSAQAEWAEAILQNRLAEKSSSMAVTGAPGGALFPA